MLSEGATASLCGVPLRRPISSPIPGSLESTPFETAPAPFSRNELMVLLEGSVTLTDGDGQEHHFTAGDSFYVPKGAVMGWKNTEKVKKFYAIYAPKD